MTSVDRYVLRIFIRTLLVCYGSLAGIFVVFHAFSNLDDLAYHGRRQGGMVRGLVDYYGPYLLALYDWTGAILTLLSVLFTVALLRRSGELTAVLAAGVSHGRILRPMLWAAVMLAALGALNREALLPHWQDQLGMKAQDLAGQAERPLLPSYDRQTGILIDGRSLIVVEKEIHAPAFKVRSALAGVGSQISGQRAQWLEAEGERPRGYLVRRVSQPAGIDQLPSASLGERTVLYTPADTEWLEPGSCFVASEVSYEFLEASGGWKKLASTPDLIRRVRNPAVHCSADVRVIAHDRFVRPLLDLVLVLLALPMVVGRSDRNLFMMAGYATLMIAGFFGLRTVFHALGAGGSWVTPASGAWAPLLALGPIAYVRLRWVDRV